MSQSFDTLGLSSTTLQALKTKGFEEPTEIQSKVIPLLLTSSQDLIAQAQTGTGKTAAFGLVFTDKLTPKKSQHPQAIVLAPTRELAVQVSEELHSLKGDNNLSIVPIYGGQSWGLQRKNLVAGADIVVGTPGRVMDHLDRGTLKLDKVQYFVLDEADEMLNMGFVEDIETILPQVNPDRQVLLFSATMPARIATLAKKYMRSPLQIKTEKDQITNNSVDQIYFEVLRRDKFEALCRIIDMEDEFYGIIFCRTKVDADEVGKHLNDRGYRAESFHGDISQDRREQILKNFKAKRTEILVATDVAARGIDVNDLTHVINYSLPQNSESYVHRIGRTGRAGKDGKAITLITPEEYRKMRLFEQRAKAEIQKKTIPGGAEMVTLKKKKLIKDLETILSEPEKMQMYEALAYELFGDTDPQAVIAALLRYSFSESLDAASYTEIFETKKGKTRTEREKHNRERVANPGGIGTTRLFLTTGRSDGATPARILKMIEKDFQVPGHTVGAIDIMESFSFITVPLQEAEMILDAFHAMKKKKRPSVRIERAANEKRSGGRPRGRSKSRPRDTKNKPPREDRSSFRKGNFEKKDRRGRR